MMKMVNEHHTYDVLPALCHQEKAARGDVGLGEHDQQDHRGVSCNRALARHLPLQVLDMAVKRSRNISDLHSRFGDISPLSAMAYVTSSRTCLRAAQEMFARAFLISWRGPWPLR